MRKEKAVNFLATWFGLGYSKYMPGTIGTLGGIPLIWLSSGLPLFLKLIIFVVLFVVGVVVSDMYEKQTEQKDPGCVVIDEVAGVYLAGIFFSFSWTIMLVVFIIFRLLDITKPFPINYFDKNIHGGLGIMLDDILAGILTVFVVALGLQLFGVFS